MRKMVRLTTLSTLCLIALGIVGCCHTNAANSPSGSISGSGAGGALYSTPTGSTVGGDKYHSSVPPINLDQE